MRFLPVIASAVATVSVVTAQAPDFRFIIDAPGPAYRNMAGTDKPRMDQTILTRAVLTFQPDDIMAATLIPADEGMSQIQLTFRPESIRKIQEFLEFNQAKPIRIEVGDYTLPLDTKKTLSGTTGVWLEARPTGKAQTVLETLKKQK